MCTMDWYDEVDTSAGSLEEITLRVRRGFGKYKGGSTLVEV